MSARAEIMRSIREQLRASAPHDALEAARAPRHHTPLPVMTGAPPDAGLDRVTRFERRLEAVGGKCTRVRDRAAAEVVLRHLLAGSTRVVRTDLESLSLSREQLFACEAGVTSAQWGIAETGTLVLASASEQHRLASLVPPVHIALLPVSRLVDTLGDVLVAVSPERNRVITMITGPSRTADIELTLVVGVHGPKELHVLLIEESDQTVNVPARR